MDKILKEHVSYSRLFENIGAGNYLHIPVSCGYSPKAIGTERTRQNKYAQSNKMNGKFSVSTGIKPGYITIYQRY